MKIFFVALMILLSAALVFANPPRDITFKVLEAELEIFVVHPSANPGQHFIKTIKAFQNDKEVFSREFSAQETEGQKTVFPLSGLKKTDKIKVLAVCSVYGQMEKEFSPD